MTHQFSIDPSLCKEASSSLGGEIEDVQSQLDDIYRRATIRDSFDVARGVVEQMNATPKELKMLSKVFDRLSILIAQRDDLASKKAALNFIEKKDDWIYNQIGAPSRDIEHFIAATLSDAEADQS